MFGLGNFDCWIICLCELDQHLLIMKLVLRYDWNFYVRHIQTGHMDFLSLQVCGRSWKGCWLSVISCWREYIYFLDIKSPLSYSHKPYFVNCWFVYIAFTRSAFIDTETFPRSWFQISMGRIQAGNTDLLPPQVCGRSWRGCRFCSCACHNQYIYWI